jgi:hypothetical protein
MILIGKVALAAAGTWLMVYLIIFLFLLVQRPWAIWKLDRFEYHPSTVSPSSATWQERLHNNSKAVKIFILLGACCFAAYQLAYWCLWWVSDDLGGLSEDEWAITRVALSIGFALYGGVSLASGVGKGVEGRVSSAQFLAEGVLRDKIDNSLSVKSLLRLQSDLDEAHIRAARMGSSKSAPPQDDRVYQQIAELLPDIESQKFAYRAAVQQINQRLKGLESMGVDVSEWPGKKAHVGHMERLIYED